MIPKRQRLVSLALLLLLTIPQWSAFTQAQAGLHVDAAQSLGEISPYTYGTNHGPWAVIPFDLMPKAEVAGITYLRFPGGEWGDDFDLTHKHIDDFIELCERLGAEPSISVRLHKGTPEKAAEVVRYTNLEMGYNVRYWSIGNEPNLFKEYDTVQHNREWRAIAEAMLAVDPSILLLGPEISQYPPNFAETPKDSSGRDWLTEFLKANGDLVDIVSVHRYPFPRVLGRATPLDDLRQNSVEWDTIIPNLRALIFEVLGRNLPVAITEVNSHWGPAYGGVATPDSFFNAIWYADVLGRFMQQRVDIVAHWALRSPNSFGGWGLIGNYDVRPTYYTFLMYKHFGSELIFTSSSDPEVTIYAARREDGTLTLMVINLSDVEKTLPLALDNFSPADEAEVLRLDAEHKAEALGVQVWGESVTLPAQSVTLYLLTENR